MDNKWEKLAPSFSLEDERLDSLKQIVPEAFTDGKVDFDVLRELLGDVVEDESAEHFGLNWTGKREARRLAGMPSKGTLVPVPGKGLHEDTTENIFIEGDNLEVLKLLHKSYRGKIKMIYIDPPYNTGNDFIYKDDYRMPLESYLERSGQKSDAGELLTSNPKSSGRFHSDWLNMMYPRLRVAKDLLREDGVIFVSIDDNELHNLKQMLNEIMGEENFIGTFVVNSTPNARDYGHIGKMHEYILFYSIDPEKAVTNELEEVDKSFKYQDGTGGFNIHPLYNSNEAFTSENRPNLYYPFYLYPENTVNTHFLEIGFEKRPDSVEIFPPRSEKNGVQFVWRWGKEKAKANLNIEIVGYKTGNGDFRVVQKMRHTSKLIRSLLLDKAFSSRRGTAEVEEVFGKKIWAFPKPVELIKNLLAVGTSDSDIVADFFAGSGTLAQAVMELNAERNSRVRFVAVQLDEKAASGSEAAKAGFNKLSEITSERIRKTSKSIQTSEDAKLVKAEKPDFGFRQYELRSSNFKAWSDYDGNDLDELRGLLQGQLDSTFVDGATEDAILTEILLLEGFPLTSRIEIDETFQKNAVHRISHDWSEHRLFVTLDKEIQEETIRTVDQMIDSDEMSKIDIFICLDNALTDQDKLRLADVCRLKTI